MDKTALAQIIESSNGKIVSVTFTKKDGSQRIMVCRLGVTSHLKGGQSTLNADQYITVFDMASKGYRAINRDTIQSVRLAGQEFAS